MPPKKKSGGKKKGGGGKKNKTEDDEEGAKPDDQAEKSHGPVIMGKTDPSKRWATLEMKLRNWTFSKFKLTLRVDTPIYVLKKKLKNRHGIMDSVSLYKDVDSKDYEITNEKWTLYEIGIDGKPEGEDPEEATIIYDFRPHDYDEPVLLAQHERNLERTSAGYGGSPRSNA